jgi:hypothetical protein
LLRRSWNSVCGCLWNRGRRVVSFAKHCGSNALQFKDLDRATPRQTLSESVWRRSQVAVPR